MRSIAKYIWIFIFIAFVGGFLLGEVSGLLGMSAIRPNTAVATVNGDKVLYLNWQALSQQLATDEERRTGRALNLDERQRFDDQAFDQLVSDLLLQQEYEKRGIRVTDAEVMQAAQLSPPQDVYGNPSFQTDGRFDPAKYQRFLASPIAKQQGVLQQLEAYYRSELPKQKLFSQLISEAWVSDERLLRMFHDERDSATVRFVALRPSAAETDSAQVSEADARRFYAQYEDRWQRPGRALVSVIGLSRVPTAADTAATAVRLRALRDEITSGRSTFDDVARRESSDTVSAAQGGDLGRGGRNRFVAPFEAAAYALRPGQVSEPVLTQFGWHLIKVNERKGDTLALQHILLDVRQNDATATLTDRRADSLSNIAGGATEPARFDSAAKTLGLLVTQVQVQQGQTAMYAGRQVGGISGWAFSGLSVGETSDLIDDDNGYYLVRVDSLTRGGKQSFESVREEILRVLRQRKAVEGLMAKAEAVAANARTAGLDAAAATVGLTAESAGPFSRNGFVPGLGYFNEAIGAAFTLPVGGVTMVRTDEAVIVLSVTGRSEASREAFEAQKAMQRERVVGAYREQKVRMFLQNLREDATIVDRRQELLAAQRRQTLEQP